MITAGQREVPSGCCIQHRRHYLRIGSVIQRSSNLLRNIALNSTNLGDVTMTSIRPSMVRSLYHITSTNTLPKVRILIRENPTWKSNHPIKGWVALIASRLSTIGWMVLKSVRRFLHATSSMKAYQDSSTIDFAYMPQFEWEETSPPEIMRIPLLPDNYSAHHDRESPEPVEPVIRPEISTVSADSTHIDSPSAMSEVTDNHAIELDPFDLTSKVTAAAAHMASLSEDKLKEPGVIQELWSSFLDDLLGSKKVAKAGWNWNEPMDGAMVMDHGRRIHFDPLMNCDDVVFYDYFYVQMPALDCEFMFPTECAHRGKHSKANLC